VIAFCIASAMTFKVIDGYGNLVTTVSDQMEMSEVVKLHDSFAPTKMVPLPGGRWDITPDQGSWRFFADQRGMLWIFPCHEGE
jgi:hypothetical protein